MPSFAKASEDTHCPFLQGLTAVASCGGGQIESLVPTLLLQKSLV